jgi:hypothetical protein
LAGCSSPSAGTNIILADQFGSGAAGLLTGSGNAIAYYAAGGATASGQNSGGATSVTTLSLGANTSGGEIMNGNLAEVIVYPTALAYTPYQQTLTYLKNKYALQ